MLIEVDPRQSSLSRFLYNQKLTMIKNPIKNVLVTLMVGFIVNLFPMTSFIIIYEKVS